MTVVTTLITGNGIPVKCRKRKIRTDGTFLLLFYTHTALSSATSAPPGQEGTNFELTVHKTLLTVNGELSGPEGGVLEALNAKPRVSIEK